MSLHLDERADGGFALYIDGDFQFDTADEGIYHESLVLPALSLARAVNPEAIRVLICGGGDGLALRECLRFPGVVSVDLVDYDSTVVDLARTRFAKTNNHAFDDPRVQVHCQDAWQFLNQFTTARPGTVTVPLKVSEARPDLSRRPSGDTQHSTPDTRHPAPVSPLFDVIICDFTVPRTPDQAGIFTREWYQSIRSVLAPGGMIALNAVSPQTSPEAFWCLRKTVRAAGLSALPYRVCIPSFRAHGYGAWGFFLASCRKLSIRDLQSFECPVPTAQADLDRLRRGARFSQSERDLEKLVPIHSLDHNCLIPLLLNPGRLRENFDESVDESPYSLEPLLRAIPITHPYHTRIMIETLAEQVASTVEQIDVRKLVEALLRRAARLPEDVREELKRLRQFLSDTTLRWERCLQWGTRLFAALVILMTLANAIAPDNAFAKGSAGLGHASMSRGYSGSFSGTGSFGGASSARAGGSFGGSSSRGSFGRTGFFTSHGLFDRSTAAPAIHGTGFRTRYANGEPIDMYGESYSVRPFHYYYGGTHSYFGGQQDGAPLGPSQEHRALFAADDDLLVMDNGDIVVTLSDRAFLLVAGGKVVLRSDLSPEPLMALYPDPVFFQNLIAQLRDRQAAAQQAIGVRKDWLSWVGWTSALLPTIAQDKTELSHLQDLDRRLGAAIERVGQPPAAASPLPALPAAQVELFVDARLNEEGDVILRQADGAWLRVDGRAITLDNAGGVTPGTTPAGTVPCPPALAGALRSVIAKLQKEMIGDIASSNHDLQQLVSDRASLEHDLREYQGLQAANGGDPSYQVDYGTDEISVSDAISRTQRDLDENTRDTEQTQKERDKLIADGKRLGDAAPTLRP